MNGVRITRWSMNTDPPPFATAVKKWDGKVDLTTSLPQKERIDGTGFPDGLSGEAIPAASRIIAICDAYDSLVSGERAERPQMADERARAVMFRQAGRAYDVYSFAGQLTIRVGLAASS